MHRFQPALLSPKRHEYIRNPIFLRLVHAPFHYGRIIRVLLRFQIQHFRVLAVSIPVRFSVQKMHPLGLFVNVSEILFIHLLNLPDGFLKLTLQFLLVDWL